MAFLGMFDARRSVSLANKYAVFVSHAANLPEKLSSRLFPAGVQRTTDPLRDSQHAIAAIKCSRSVVTKIASASQRLKMFLSLRAAVNTQSSVENGMISNGSGIGVCLGWFGARRGETARCTLLSGVTRSVTLAPRSEIPRAALANRRAVPDHSRAV
jgi:hypothetical protein